MDTHGPYEPPGEYATLYANHGLSERNAQSLYQRTIDDPDSITDEERQLLIDLYDAEIRYNDMRIGEFLESLRERGLLEESLVVFTADHGDAFGEHGYYEHPRYLHDEITKVPLFVRPPGGQSEDIKLPASTLDIVPTAESVVGLDADVSLLDDFEDDRRVFSQARGEDSDSHLRRYALRTRENSCFCERDMNTGEIRVTETTARSLRTELEAHVKQRVRVENGDESVGDNEIDEEINARLEALGYKN
jgi:arylsulfatase